MGGIIHRMKELRQRRKRKKKMGVLKRKAVKASASEKAVMATKIRRMTPGARNHHCRARFGREALVLVRV